MNNRPPGFDALTWLVIVIAVMFIVTPLVIAATNPSPTYRTEMTQ